MSRIYLLILVSYLPFNTCLIFTEISDPCFTFPKTFNPCLIFTQCFISVYLCLSPLSRKKIKKLWQGTCPYIRAQRVSLLCGPLTSWWMAAVRRPRMRQTEGKAIICDWKAGLSVLLICCTLVMLCGLAAAKHSLLWWLEYRFSDNVIARCHTFKLEARYFFPLWCHVLKDDLSSVHATHLLGLFSAYVLFMWLHLFKALHSVLLFFFLYMREVTCVVDTRFQSGFFFYSYAFSIVHFYYRIAVKVIFCAS